MARTRRTKAADIAVPDLAAKPLSLPHNQSFCHERDYKKLSRVKGSTLRESSYLEVKPRRVSVGISLSKSHTKAQWPFSIPNQIITIHNIFISTLESPLPKGPSSWLSLQRLEKVCRQRYARLSEEEPSCENDLNYQKCPILANEIKKKISFWSVLRHFRSSFNCPSSSR